MYGNKNSCITSTTAHFLASLVSPPTPLEASSVVANRANENGIVHPHKKDKCYIFTNTNSFIKTDSEANRSDKSNAVLFPQAPDSCVLSGSPQRTSVTRSVTFEDSVDASVTSDSGLTGMSRRKQNKPRHLDAENEEGDGASIDCTAKTHQDIVPNKDKQDCSKVVNMTSLTPESGLLNGDVKQFDDHITDDKSTGAKNESKELSPPFRDNKLNHHLPETGTPVRPYSHPTMNIDVRAAPLISSSPREDSQLSGMAHAYFRGLSVKDTGSAFSDDDADIPSDIDSNEPSEPLGDADTNKDTSESGFMEGSSGLKTQTDEEGTDSNRSGNSGSDDVVDDKENRDIVQPCEGVKLQTLDTTKVAVAQVVDSKEDASGEKLNSNIPTIQQVLFTLHQQQMFQLHILQQIQQQVAKYSTESEDNGDAGGAMEMPWLHKGGFSTQTGSGVSSAADDISEGSGGSFMGNDEFQDEPRLAENGSPEDKIEDDFTEPKEDHGSRSSPSSSLFADPPPSNDNRQSPILPTSRPASIPQPPRCEPFGFSRSGIISSFMPGFNPFTPSTNPLLPSNLFNPSPLQNRMPMFRPYFPPPPPEDEDSMEEFMEIEKTESSKLEELVKKMEPTLKDPNQCAICKRILSCKSALQMHYRTHTGERPFKCKICGRAFTTKGNLKTHMSVHRTRPSGQIHHQCPVCSKQFSNVLLLQEHVRMHVGEMNKSGFAKPPLLPPPNYMQLMGFPPMLPPHMQPPKLSPGHMDFSKAPAEFRDEFPLHPEMKTPNKDTVLGDRSNILKRPAEDEESNESKKQKEAKDFEMTKAEDNVNAETVSSEGKDIVKNSDDMPSYGGSLLALQESVKEMDRLMHTPSHPIGMSDPFLYDSPAARERSPENHTNDGKPREKSSPGQIESPLPVKQEEAHTSVITHSGTPSQALPATRPVVNNNVTPPACPSSPFRTKRESLRHVCQVCHKPFSSGSALQIHMRTHTGERPFKCSVCGKGFTTKGNLKVHMSTHACQNGPPRRGRRMSMDTLPPFSGPNKFQTLSPRPPLPLGYPGFQYPAGAFNGLLLQNKGFPTLMPPVFPGFSFDRQKPTTEKEDSLSPSNAKKQTESIENNNLQPKGMYGELDLSMRASSQPIKT